MEAALQIVQVGWRPGLRARAAPMDSAVAADTGQLGVIMVPEGVMVGKVAPLMVAKPGAVETPMGMLERSLPAVGLNVGRMAVTAGLTRTLPTTMNVLARILVKAVREARPATCSMARSPWPLRMGIASLRRVALQG